MINKIKTTCKNTILLHNSNEQEALIAEGTLQIISDYEKLLKKAMEHDKNCNNDCYPVGLYYD